MNDRSKIVTEWAEKTTLEPIHIDCTTAVMLKILDGKCKMFPHEKEVMGILYDAINDRPGKHLGEAIHELISKARQRMDDDLIMQVYEQRLYAETMIGRPTMKGFKAMLRQEGLIG